MEYVSVFPSFVESGPPERAPDSKMDHAAAVVTWKMPDPIANRSPEEVIEAIEGNLVDASVALGRTEDGVVFRGSDVTWVYTGYGALNRVMRARFAPEEAEDRVAEIAECFRQWNAPVAWFMGPTSFPPEMGDYLHEAGFSSNEQWMGMAGDLANLPRPAAAASLRIEVISEKQALEDWAALSSEGWGGDGAEAALSIFSAENAGSDPRCRYYLGYAGGKPAVRGVSCVRSDIVGLYWISCRPEIREAGYDIALANQALTDARNDGARLGLMPVRTSQSALCQRLGFKPYCQFNVYTWPAGTRQTPVC